MIYLSAVLKILQRKRTCPKCRRDQIVPYGKKRDTVQCKFCKADILPK